MKILVTGGAGFIGSHLCLRLINLGHNVCVVDKLTTQIHGDIRYSYTYNSIKDKVEFIHFDVSNPFLYEHLNGRHFDVIVCLAAETGTGQSMYEAYKYCQVNVNSMAVLNDAILKKQITTNKIVLASSRAVYGEAELTQNTNIPIASNSRWSSINPLSIYAATKFMQEQILNIGFEGVSKSILRLQNVYGEGQSLKNPYTGIISIFSNAIKNGKDIEIFEDGLMSRDFVYIDDVVDSFIVCIDNNTNNYTVDVGSGVRTTVLEVANTLKKIYNSSVEIKTTGEKRKGDIRHNYADLSFLNYFGVMPKIDFETGIKKFVDWSEKQNNVDYNNYSETLEDLRKKGLLKHE